MPAGKIKNLILVILALANCFLLSLVVPSHLESTRRRQAESAKLTELFRTANVTLREELPEGKKLHTMKLSCRSEELLPGLRTLLGDELLVSEATYHTEYASDRGVAAADGKGLTVTLKPGVQMETAALLANFGGDWGSTELRTEDGKELETCLRWIDGVPVWNGELTLTRENGELIAVESALLPTTAAAVKSGEAVCCSAQDALMAFWGSRLEIGWFGSQIEAVEQGFMSTNSDTPATVLLRPCWAIITDTGEYLVDGMDRTVTIFTKF